MAQHATGPLFLLASGEKKDLFTQKNYSFQKRSFNTNVYEKHNTISYFKIALKHIIIRLAYKQFFKLKAKYDDVSDFTERLKHFRLQISVLHDRF